MALLTGLCIGALRVWLCKQLSGPLCRAASVVVVKQSFAVLKPRLANQFCPLFGRCDSSVLCPNVCSDQKQPIDPLQ